MEQKDKVFVFEGIDGCGKTTQLKMAAATLAARNIPYTEVRLPGQTELGMQIRQMFIDKIESIVPQAVTMLFAADCAQTVQKVIKPALDRGDYVLIDRFRASPYAYDKAFDRYPPAESRVISEAAACGIKVAVTFIFDVAPEIAGRRLADRENNTDAIAFFDNAAIEIQLKLQQAYREWGMSNVDARFVDASRTSTEVAFDVQRCIDSWIKHHFEEGANA